MQRFEFGNKNAMNILVQPADLHDISYLEKEIEQYKQQDEDVLTYALFPQVAIDYFKYRDAQKTGVDEKEADKATVEGYYNTSGIRINALQQGINIIKMSDGTFKKVLVK